LRQLVRGECAPAGRPDARSRCQSVARDWIALAAPRVAAHRRRLEMLRQTQRGFTLIEILVVVVILGIASAVIIPQLGSRDDINAAAAARLVMADIIYAQNSAIVQQKKFYIDFSTANRYAIYDDSSLSTPIKHPIRHDAFITLFGQRGTPTQMVSTGDVNFGGYKVLQFDELGTPSGFDPVSKNEFPLTATAGTVQVKSGTYTLTLQVQPYTGEISVPKP
jgi:prepilin-type N-terminal cleavage/methylation domain-containing protein